MYKYMYMSSLVPVNSGVVQSSALGPALWIVFMDSLLASVDIMVSAFADDLKFIAKLKKYKVDSIQLNINQVYDGSIIMGVPLSVCKLLVMHYGSNNSCHVYHCGPLVFEVSTNFFYLSVLCMSYGQFHGHITCTAKKGKRLCGMIHKLTSCCDKALMLRFYNAYVFPAVIYAWLIWSPSLQYENELLESIQQRYTKFLAGIRNCSYGQRLYDLGLPSLKSAQIKSDLILTYKKLHNIIGILSAEAGLFLCTNNTQAKGLRLQQPLVSSNVSASLFKFRVTHLWNNLPINIITCDHLPQFKHALEKWLLSADLAFYD